MLYKLHMRHILTSYLQDVRDQVQTVRNACETYTDLYFRARRKVATEKDFLAAVDKVIKGNLKFNSTATYMQYN